MAGLPLAGRGRVGDGPDRLDPATRADHVGIRDPGGMERGQPRGRGFSSSRAEPHVASAFDPGGKRCIRAPDARGDRGHDADRAGHLRPRVLATAALRETDSRAIVVALPALALSLRFKPLLAVARGASLDPLGPRRAPVRHRGLLLASMPVWLTIGVVELQNVDTRGASPTTNPFASAVAHAPPRALLVKGAEQIAGRSFPSGRPGHLRLGLNETRRAAQLRLGGARRNGWVHHRGSALPGGFAGSPQPRRAWRSRDRLWLVGMAALIVLALRLGGGHLFPAAALVSALALAPVSPSFKATNEALLFLLPASLALLGLPSARDTSLEGGRAE